MNFSRRVACTLGFSTWIQVGSCIMSGVRVSRMVGEVVSRDMIAGSSS
jgi:hypothetical protein